MELIMAARCAAETLAVLKTDSDADIVSVVQEVEGSFGAAAGGRNDSVGIHTDTDTDSTDTDSAPIRPPECTQS
eukprot:1265218-Pyramimonas_sp.AAC.1